MTTDLKQRIVGIVVLIFLALIILPWLSGNNQPYLFGDKSGQEPENLNIGNLPKILKEAPPPVKPIPTKEVRSGTALDQNTSGAVTKIPLISVKQPTSEFHQPIDSLPRVTEISAAKLTKIENAIVHSQAVSDQATISQATIPKVEKHNTNDIELTKPDFSKLKVFTKPTHNKKSNSVITTDKLWAIQLGSFSNQENVTKLTKQLKKKGYPVYYKHIKGEKLTKVFVGPIEKQQEATKKLQEIEKLTKVHGMVVKKAV